MENKATLARAIKELQRLQDALNSAVIDANNSSAGKDESINAAKKELRLKFEMNKNVFKGKISDCIAMQKDAINERIYSNPSKVNEVNAILEEDKLLDSIYSILSAEQVEAYQPTFTKNIPNEALELNIRQLEEYAEDLPYDFDFDKIFIAIEHLNEKMSGTEENPNSENGVLKKYLVYILTLVVTFILMLKASEFLFVLYFIIGVFSYLSMYRVTRFLNLYASIMDSIGNGSSSETLEKTRQKLLKQVDSFMESCELEYYRKIDNMEYRENKNDISRIELQADEDANAKRQRVMELQFAVERAQAEVDRIKKELELIEIERAKRSLSIEEKYLTFNKFEWQDNLPEDIYLGKNKKGDPVLFPVIHDNVLFVANESEYLFSFVRLFVIQMLMKVNPDYITQYILDYKYMAGNLQQFMNLPQRCVSLLMEKEKIDERLEAINIDILARNRNILKSVNSLEEFNTLMKTYDSVGEGYVFVHIFGLAQLTELYMHFLRNGVKVGYYFYIYLTMEEYKLLKSEELLDLLTNFYFIGDNMGVGVYPDKRLRGVMASYLTTA